MSHLISTLLYILLIIIGAGILGWLWRRWSREGFSCGAGGPSARGGGSGEIGPNGHEPLSYAVEPSIGADGKPLAYVGDDSRYAAILAERDALKLDVEDLRLKAQEGEALRARLLSGEGAEGLGASGGYALNFDGAAELNAELNAARARIAELEGSAGAPRDVVSYVALEGEPAESGVLARLRAELDAARARITSYESGSAPAALGIAGAGALAAGAALGSGGSGSGELDALRAELIDTRNRLADAEARARLHEVEAADVESHGLRADLVKAHDHIVALQAKAQAAAEKAEALQGEIVSLTASGQSEAEELAALRLRLKEAQTGSASAEFDLTNLRADLEAANRRLADLQETAATAEASWSAKLVDLEGGSVTAHAEIDDLRAALAAAQKRLGEEGDAALSLEADLRRQLETARLDIAGLQETAATAEASWSAKLIDLEGGSTAAQTEIDGLRAALDAAQQRRSDDQDVVAVQTNELNAHLAAARDRIAELESEAAEVVSLRAQAKTAHDDSVAVYAELEDLRADLAKSKEQLEDQKSAEDSETWALRKDLEEARIRIAELESGAGEGHFLTAAESASIDTSDEGVFAELSAARARIADLEAQLQAGGREVVSYVWREGDAPAASFAAATAEAHDDHEAQASGGGLLARLRAELHEVRARLTHYETQDSAPVASSFASSAGDSDETASLRLELTALRNRLADAEAVNNAAAAQETAHEADSVGLRLDLEAARQKAAELEAKAASDQEAWRLRLSDLEGGSATAKTELDGLRAQLEAAHSRLSEEAAAAEAAQAKLQAEFDAATRKFTAEASAETSEISDLRYDLEAARATIAELQGAASAEGASWSARLADLEGGSATAKLELDELRAQLEAARHRLSEESAAAEAAQTQLRAQLQADLDAATRSFAEEKSAEDATASGLRDDLEAARVRIAELEAAPQPAASADDTDALRLRIVKLEAGASSSSSEIELLRADLRAARARAADLEAALEAAGSARLGLAGFDSGEGSSFDLDALRLDLSQAQDRIRALESQPAGVLEIREVIRYVERPAAHDEDERDDLPLTDEEREADTLIRSGGAGAIARPEHLLAAPRDGESADDLKLIRGIGPKLEGLLNYNGIYYFEQLAAFSPRDIAWIDGQLAEFPGRILRDRWVPQAREFARLKREGRLPGARAKSTAAASSAASSAVEAPAKKASLFVETHEAPPARAPAPQSVSSELIKVEADALRLIDSGQTFDESFKLHAALPSPLRGEPDDLKRIRGVAYKLEEQLHALGIYYFSQIAEMTPQEAAWLDYKLSLRGRVIRYRWIAQAQVFAGEVDRR